jgi:hypothetical protein
MALGEYTWYWLRRPIMPVHFPPTDFSVQTGAAEPEVHEDLQIERMLLVALKRINGRLERAQRQGNNGQSMKYMQSRTWLLSCVSYYADCSPVERTRMASNLSDDDESPQHGLGEDEKNHALVEADKAFKAMMSLLEYDTFEEVTKLVGQLGGALREIKPQSSDESMPEENQSQRARRYTQCGQSEASDPDYWADVKYGPAAREDEPEPPMNDSGLMEF